MARPERRSRTDARIDMGPEDWCRAYLEPGSAAWHCLAVVERLECTHSVAEWAAAVGLPRVKLHELLAGWLRATPTDALWWYVEAQLTAQRQQGRSLARIARCLGYANSATLSRAWRRRHGCAPPGRSLDQ